MSAEDAAPDYCVWVKVSQGQELVEDCHELATQIRYAPEHEPWPLCAKHVAEYDEQLIKLGNMPPGET